MLQVPRVLHILPCFTRNRVETATMYVQEFYEIMMLLKKEKS
jgi:hypothetical protein